MSTDCIFCRIVAGDIPAAGVAEGDRVMAFEDANPAAPTHVLIVPKEHRAESVADPEAAGLMGEIVELARSIAADRGLQGGWRLVTNVGPDAGQSVYHLHVHLLGGRSMSWPPG
ncbi:MAG: histidine triad nucleotide-binding protein [Acidimicrobiia bacterium]